MQVGQTHHPSCKYYSVCMCHQTMLHDDSRHTLGVRITRLECYDCVYTGLANVSVLNIAS